MFQFMKNKLSGSSEPDWSRVCDCCDATISAELPEYQVNDPTSREVMKRKPARLCSICAATFISNKKYYYQPGPATSDEALDLTLGLVKAINALVECLGKRQEFDSIMQDSR